MSLKSVVWRKISNLVAHGVIMCITPSSGRWMTVWLCMWCSQWRELKMVWWNFSGQGFMSQINGVEGKRDLVEIYGGNTMQSGIDRTRGLVPVTWKSIVEFWPGVALTLIWDKGWAATFSDKMNVSSELSDEFCQGGRFDVVSDADLAGHRSEVCAQSKWNSCP